MDQKRQLTEVERERIERNRLEALLRRQQSMAKRELTDTERERIEKNRQEALRRRQLSVTTSVSAAKVSSAPLSTSGTSFQRSATVPGSTRLSFILRGAVPKPPSKVPSSDVQPIRPAISNTPHVQETFQASGPRSHVPVRASAPTLKRSASSDTNVPPPKAFRPAPPRLKTRAVCVLVNPEEFEVQGRYHAGLNLVFKSMPTRNYDKDTRTWRFKLSDYREFLRRATEIDDVQLEGLSSAVVTAFSDKIDQGKAFIKNTGKGIRLEDFLPSKLVDALMDFQKEGVKFALEHEGRVLLADDMGLGKTVQALAIAAAYRAEWPLLVVAPVSLRGAWRTAAERWLGLTVDAGDVHEVTSLADALSSPSAGSRPPLSIFTYDLLARYAEQRRRDALGEFNVVVMDESHNLKNLKASRTKAALPIIKAAKRAILLTGTPVLSRPLELFPQIVALRPSLFRGGLHEFGLRYCAAKEKTWGWDYTGCSNLNELHLLLQATIMIRRLKSEVLSQLPPKFRQVVVLDSSLVKKAAGVKNPKLVNLTALDLNGLEKHGEMLRFFKQSCNAKIPAVCQYISDLLESTNKFIIFAHHQEMLDALCQMLDSKKVRWIRIDGRTPTEQRRVACERFQVGEVEGGSGVRVAVLSITAAATGLNLTAASLVVFAELFWNPGVLVQAEDRAHRIGQRDSVDVHYLIAPGTVDEQLWSLVKNKLDVLSQVGLNQESFDNITFNRANPTSSSSDQRLDKFLTTDPSTETKPTPIEVVKENIAQQIEFDDLLDAIEADEECFDEVVDAPEVNTVPRVSALLPPVAASGGGEKGECNRSSKILVPDSPIPSPPQASSASPTRIPASNGNSLLDDGADDLLLDLLDDVVLPNSDV